MIFKCKICGGNLDVKQGERVTECEYCGVRQSVSSFVEPKIQEIYERANNYLMHNEFDKAENLYNQILFENKQDADAYWNVLMCRYGVTYVKDPQTGKYIPTCNRTLYMPIFNDENYINAIKYAQEGQKALFEENAQTIDKIQQGILSISKHEKPFDIFISYKETTSIGSRTKDSIKAQELYEQLTNEGYKVFFSRITLEDKIGAEYEPYIYAALASSKVMITISSSKENLEAVWVKNEWSRFLSFRQKDNSKTLIPLYFEMSKDELPEDFAYLSSYDMTIDGFEQELIRGIKKLIPTPIIIQERKKKKKKIIKRISIAAMICLVIGGICAIPWFAKLPEYNAAMQLYYDKNYPEATWAFDALGSYRDSDKMKEKCEKSWRNSLASVVVDAFDSVDYVTSNGTVDSIDMVHRTTNNVIKDFAINEHGKIASIITNGVLYDDGAALAFVNDFDNGGKLKEIVDENPEWNNIIQLYSTNQSNIIFGLKSDGKIIYCNDDVEYDGGLEEIKNWTNIKSFILSNDNTEEYCRPAVIIALNSDGNLYGIEGNWSNENRYQSISYITDKFNNISEFSVQFNNTYVTNLEGRYNIAALTDRDTIQLYIDDKFSEQNVEDAIDVSVDTDGNVYILKSDYKVYPLNSEKYILEDIINLSDGYAIARSGTLYDCGYGGYGTNAGASLGRTKVKVRTFDEWIERIK